MNVSDSFSMPLSTEAEVAILGAILLNNAHYQEAAGQISAEDLSLDAHRRIYTRIGDLLGSAKSVDIVTLSEDLRRTKEIAAVGGVAYLASLTEGLPRRISIGEYVRIVKEKSLLRQTILAAEQIAFAAADQSGRVDEVLG